MELDFEATYETQAEEFTPLELANGDGVDELLEIDPEVSRRIEYENKLKEAEQKGYEAGMAKADEEIRQLKNELQQWLTWMQNPIKLLDEEVSSEIAKTIQWICCSCIGIELSLHPDKLIHLIEAIKKELPSLKNAKQLAMNPDDVEWLKNNLEQFNGNEFTELLYADAGLQRGDFYLRGEHFELDGKLINRLEQLLLEQFNLENKLSEETKKMDDQ